MEKKISSAAAREELGAASGRLMTVRTTLASPPVEIETPVQRSLPGMHLVPASPPSEERLRAALDTAVGEAASVGAPPAAQRASSSVAFFEAFQDERGQAFPGVPREAPPPGWADWHRQALDQVGQDEGRLLEACRAYLSSDWGRTRQPAGTARAFCSPKVWVRYVAPLASPAPSTTGSAPPSVDTSVDTSTEAGRRWRDCLAWLHDDGRRYAVTWLAQARPVDLVEGVLVLEAPNSYVGQWLREHYGPLLEQVARQFALTGIRWYSGEEVPLNVEGT